MLVNLFAFLKRSKTLPAYMSLAVSTGHVVTTVRTFDRRSTTRTALDIVMTFPIVKLLLVFGVHVGTFATLVSLEVTGSANAHQA